ncbi:MAG: methyltransferase domain-containing protein, partial [Gammaproteobacteria bacterium]
MNKTNEITACEVCGNHELNSVLNLGSHPLCDDLVPIGDTRICKEYPIDILFCSQCLTAHQRFQVPKHELFTQDYHYRSRFTMDVLNGMSALVTACEKRLSTLSNKIVLDIGCNDGSLLNYFRAKGCTTIGIEPTAAYADAQENGHRVYNDFLSNEIAETILKKHGHPDIITFTNVFAHIENLPAVIESLKRLCTSSTMIVIENHYLGAILHHNQFDTFYHEHPRTYSYTSFIYISKSLDKRINHVEFPSRYGGNIRIFLGGPP